MSPTPERIKKTPSKIETTSLAVPINENKIIDNTTLKIPIIIVTYQVLTLNFFKSNELTNFEIPLASNQNPNAYVIIASDASLFITKNKPTAAAIIPWINSHPLPKINLEANKA